jgi:isoleucyl-tRNA synthetase
MKANLVQNEPASLKRWGSMEGGAGLYERVRRARAGSPRYVFHDGPPYANGSIHMGHLLNKCLKDLVVRSMGMLPAAEGAAKGEGGVRDQGQDCPFVPGWDCHGLPIEHKVMQEMVEKGTLEKLRGMDDWQRRLVIRRECRRYAEKYIRLQAGQMQRLLTLADYEHPYLTMDPAYEAATLEVLAGLLEQGLVYRALKPVHWSIANETALAEAELEYYDREDPSVYVDFEALDSDAVYDAFGLGPSAEDEEVEEAAEDGTAESNADARKSRFVPGRRPHQRPTFMIWTTTPWTLPANVAVAVNPAHPYALVFVDGNVTVIAADLVERVTRRAGAQEVVVLGTAPGARLVGLRYRHPFVDAPPPCGLGRVCDERKLWSIVAADYVTLEDGTGLVHTAPGHGQDDFATGLREHLPIYCPVRGDGTYDDTAPPWLRGVSVWEANARVTEHLRRSGHLFFDHTVTHSYPHDWRGKTPTIFRCTEQWFVAVDGRHEGSRERREGGEGRNLRRMALAATGEGGEVTFVPEWGRNRMRGMLEARPDWCISRQRSWGLPIPAFETPDGAVVMTAATVRAVAKVFREKGSDAWFTMAPADLLAHYDAAADPDLAARPLAGALARGGDALHKGRDILDVWFESGSSWNAVLRERDLGYPADLYLEGSDQHRGWFQLSLLPALGVTGRAPFRTLLTHGFMVDKDGRKMSKSLGNTLEVEDVLKQHGADVCRWWVASLSYENDIKVDPSFFAVAGESYRKVRNTLRFLLSNLYDYDPPGAADWRGRADGAASEFPPASLDAWVLGEFNAMSRAVTAAYRSFDFRAAHGALYDFCNSTLSATYLAAVKDRLYCDRPDSPRRRRTQSAMHLMADGLCRLLAPILPHTADEAWRALHRAAPGNADCCVHLETFAPPAAIRPDPSWPAVMAARDRALVAIERAKSTIGVDNPLDMGVVLPDPDGTLGRFDRHDLADLLGVSRVALEAGASEIRILDLRAEPRCERSWKRDGTVRRRAGRDGLPDAMLSDRDAAAVGLA